jgi:transposase
MAYIESHGGESWLLPPSLEDLIPEDHICFLIEGLVDSLDYSCFDIRYSGAGHPAYHPKILVKLLIMGVLDRVRSSRRLARNARENVVYIYLAEKLTPDFRTISDFRKDNPDLLKEVFKHTVSFAKEEGLLDLSYLATDGTKVKANASNRRVLTKEELAVLTSFVDGELQEWAEIDESEDRQFGELRGSDQLSRQGKKLVQKAAQYYVKRVKEEGHVFIGRLRGGLQEAQDEVNEEELKQVSTTDPDSRFMKNKKGRIELSYNPQVTVDKGGFILASDAGQNAADVGQLQPQVIQTGENIGGLPENITWSFDSGYCSGENIAFLSDRKIDAYMPDNSGMRANNPYDKKNFLYNEQKDEYICPADHLLTFLGEHFDRQKDKMVRVYRGQRCLQCEHQRLCTKQKDGIRYLKMFPHEVHCNVMTAKMKTPVAKEIYKLRQQIVEPVIGDIKENKGLRTFLTRGINSVRAEFALVCAAVNLKKIWEYLKGKGRPLKDGNGCLTPRKPLLETLWIKQIVPLCIQDGEVSASWF